MANEPNWRVYDTEVNPLLCIPHPRDISEFAEAIKKIKCDKLFACYMDEQSAYDNLRKYFLASGKYDYMVLCSDDLLATPEAFEMLKEGCQQAHFPYLAGIMNITYQWQEIYGCKVPSLGGTYCTTYDIPRELKKQNSAYYLHVSHDAFTLPFIRNDIVAGVPFRASDRIGAFDIAFSADLHNYKIPGYGSSPVAMYVDTRAKMLHLANRRGDGLIENSMVGVKPPHMHWEAADITEEEKSIIGSV